MVSSDVGQPLSAADRRPRHNVATQDYFPNLWTATGRTGRRGVRGTHQEHRWWLRQRSLLRARAQSVT